MSVQDCNATKEACDNVEGLFAVDINRGATTSRLWLPKHGAKVNIIVQGESLRV